MIYSFLDYFTDPILRGPTIGCMLMCCVAALVGVIAFLKKQSLLGESLSHSAYPGVILGVIIVGELGFTSSNETLLALVVIIGAFFTAYMGLLSINYLQKRLHIHADAALCFVLSAFFGIGVTLASDVQFSYPVLYVQAQAYLFGQAASMTDQHIAIYGLMTLLVLLTIIFFYKEIQISTFNLDYARSLGINEKLINNILLILIVLAIVIGIRSVGVVLISAMLVCPVVTARQFSHKLSTIFMLASFFGVISGFLGNLLSVELDYYLSSKYSNLRIILPTGPMIVLVAAFFCMLSLGYSRLKFLSFFSCKRESCS